MALGLLGKEIPEVSFPKQLVDLDLYCNAVLRFVTVVLMEVAPEAKVLERVGSFHPLRPLDLLAHLPQNIDQLWPLDGEVRDVWPRGHCHPFCLLDRPVLVPAPISIFGVPS